MNVSTFATNFVAKFLMHVPFIGEHSIKTALLSYYIASELFSDESSALFSALGGLVHDIGFVVPKYTKPLFDYRSAYALSELESSSRNVFAHTTIGGYIISNFLGMYEYADIAFYHHTPAPELDEDSFTHVVANIVGISDLVVSYLENTSPPLSKRIIPEILEKRRDNFFPDIYPVAMELLKKDYTWWSLENAKYHIEDMVLNKMNVSEMIDIDSLIDIGHFTAYLVDAKSSFTRKHSERIATLARDIAREFGMDDEKAKLFYVAGLFHDIGKIAIPLNILEKPARLDDTEFWYMRQHIYYTEILLKDFENFGCEWPIWARQHHERLDGTGYPRRLKGEELPLESRILQVCDVFVAFTEDRPYRDPLDFSEALGIIEKEVKAGKMDGEVLEKLKIMVRNGYRFPEKTVTEEIVETVEFLMNSLG